MQGELGSIFQKESDSVVIFANELRKKGQELGELFKENTAEYTAQLQSYKNKIDENIRQCFLYGLIPEIDQRMPACNTMAMAYTKAIEIERQLIAKRELRGEIGKVPENKKTINEPIESKPVKFIKNDQNQNKNKNNESNQRNSSSNGNQNRNNPQNRNNGQNNRTSFQNGNFSAKSGTTCQICGKFGHSAKTCFTRTNNQRTTNIACQICNRKNHTSKRWLFLE